jgi:hypothetical protein
MFPQHLQDFGLGEPWGLCFDYRKRVCLGYNLPSRNGKGRSMVCRLRGIRGRKRVIWAIRNGRASPIRIQSRVFALWAVHLDHRNKL